jgi:hypothetical protein
LREIEIAKPYPMPGGPYSALGFLFDHNAQLSSSKVGALVRRLISVYVGETKVTIQFSYDPMREIDSTQTLHAVQELWRHMYTNDRVDGVIVE